MTTSLIKWAAQNSIYGVLHRISEIPNFHISEQSRRATFFGPLFRCYPCANCRCIKRDIISLQPPPYPLLPSSRKPYVVFPTSNSHSYSPSSHYQLLLQSLRLFALEWQGKMLLLLWLC